MNNSLAIFRKSTEAMEQKWLSPFAALSKNHSRYSEPEEDHRLPYKRDVDRIIHSKAYARYADKTQVVYLVDNDHVTYRGLHVQLVSSFARGIGEILRLNLDLIEAIALGHDIGHPPFGHEGENYLSELSIEYGNQPFMHPIQSCRFFQLIEPLNLGFAVYDGFLCHDGGIQKPLLVPHYDKTWKEFEQEIVEKTKNPKLNCMPSTLEGCLVKICDTISYLARDLEDAITLGLVSRDQVPKTILGDTNKSILTVAAQDIITHSFDKDHIAFSETVFDALKTLRQFNFNEIYFHPYLKVESHKIKTGYRLLFEYLLKNYESDPKASYLWNNFIKTKSEQYILHSHPVQIIVDYISGMTNQFFIRSLEKLFIPQKIQLSPCVH